MCKCCICGSKLVADENSATVFTEAGEWLAENIWKDSEKLCVPCLDNRAKLAMMYLHEFNR